jgi:hypothetical protein
VGAGVLRAGTGRLTADPGAPIPPAPGPRDAAFCLAAKKSRLAPSKVLVPQKSASFDHVTFWYARACPNEQNGLAADLRIANLEKTKF